MWKKIHEIRLKSEYTSTWWQNDPKNLKRFIVDDNSDDIYKIDELINNGISFRETAALLKNTIGKNKNVNVGIKELNNEKMQTSIMSIKTDPAVLNFIIAMIHTPNLMSNY